MLNSVVISDIKRTQIAEKIEFLYGKDKTPEILSKIEALINAHIEKSKNESLVKTFDQNDIILITYGDSIKEEGQAPLAMLQEFLKNNVKEVINSVHILPFYPFTSDDGFSVVDYYAVNTDLGDWNNVKELAKDFRLMFDGVINHISSKSEWFIEYLKGNPKYDKYFTESDPNLDYSSVTRPRTLPLLTEFETAKGKKYIWTTFSDDQIDLNFKNEKVLYQILDLLLFYAEQNAILIRLDAIGYMWKELDTSCINLEQAHKCVQLFRDVLEIAAPQTKIITETNVPHKDNVAYFGNGYNESHMVYNFSLPPLTLYSFMNEQAEVLSRWADSLEFPGEETAFFNFLASHDGIGVMPAKGFLNDEEVNQISNKVIERGGLVSYKNNSDGTQSPYELNINYMDALSDKTDSDELRIKRFLAAYAILLSLKGMPAIYIHSLLGSRNYTEGVKETGRNRTINREKLDKIKLESELKNANSLRYKLFNSFKDLIKKRKKEIAFHPNAEQKVLFLNNAVFSILRSSKEDSARILVLINVSNKNQEINITDVGLNNNKIFDVITNKGLDYDISNIILEPYQVMWLKG